MIAFVLAAALAMADPETSAGSASTPAPSAAAENSAPAPKPSVAASKGERVCVKEPVLGSRMAKTRCYTKDEAATARADQRQELDRMQRDVPITNN